MVHEFFTDRPHLLFGEKYSLSLYKSTKGVLDFSVKCLHFTLELSLSSYIGRNKKKNFFFFL